MGVRRLVHPRKTSDWLAWVWTSGPPGALVAAVSPHGPWGKNQNPQRGKESSEGKDEPHSRPLYTPARQSLVVQRRPHQPSHPLGKDFVEGDRTGRSGLVATARLPHRSSVTKLQENEKFA